MLTEVTHTRKRVSKPSTYITLLCIKTFKVSCQAYGIKSIKAI